MATISSAFSRDVNRVPITTLGLVASKAITYVAGTTGAVGATTLFTVTGVVSAQVFGIVSGADLTGSGTLEVGVAGGTALIIAQTTGTNLDDTFVWVDATPAVSQALPSAFIVDKDIIQTIGTDTIDSGTITYYCIWSPISDDGNIAAA